MKKLAIPMLMLTTAVMLFAGCVRQVVNTNIPPLGYIDSVSSSQIYAGETIKFSGHGVPSAGQIVAYRWRSNVNGDLSQLATFDTTALTAGPHTIWFKVQDSYGNWSQEVGTNVNVLVQGAPTKMNIKVFGASPPSIKEGDWATISWDVSGSGTVTIFPDIGEVSVNGSRSVQPLKTTVYTLNAKNDEGLVQATTQIAVEPVQLTTLVLYSIPAEDGTIKGKTVDYNQVLVGQDDLNQRMYGFLSFDISSIPPNAIIKSVQLDLTRASIINSPFPWQGSLLVYNNQYGQRIDPDGNIITLSALPLFSWSYGYAAQQMPESPFTSPEFARTVQKLVDTRDSRFQVRLAFEKYWYYGQTDYTNKVYQLNTATANYIDVGSGNPSLIVRYMLSQ